MSLQGGGGVYNAKIRVIYLLLFLGTFRNRLGRDYLDLMQF